MFFIEIWIKGHEHHSVVFIINFEHIKDSIQHITLVYFFLTLNICFPVRKLLQTQPKCDENM